MRRTYFKTKSRVDSITLYFLRLLEKSQLVVKRVHFSESLGQRVTSGLRNGRCTQRSIDEIPDRSQFRIEHVALVDLIALQLLEIASGEISDLRMGRVHRWQRSRMLSPVPEETGPLGEILLAYVALVRPDTGVGQHVLVKIAARVEGLLTEYARVDLRLAVFETFVAHQFARTAILLAAVLALEALLVEP